MLTVHQLLQAKGSRVLSVSPDDSVLDAIKVMAAGQVGALLVMNQGSLLGVISERDYARKVILENRSSSDTRVSDIMTSPVLTVGPEDGVRRCMEVMTEARVRHLPVVAEGVVVGVVSIGDLVKAVIEEQRDQIEQLEHYIVG